MNLVNRVVWGVLIFSLARTSAEVSLNSTIHTSESITLENIEGSVSLNDSNRFVDAKSLTIINCTFAQSLSADAFDSLVNLQNLSIIASNLSEVKKWTQLTSLPLTRIDLHGNNIWQIGFASFAPYANLVELNLSRNRIARINNETFYRANQLESIDLSENSLEQIDEFTFTELLRLKSLNLRQNKIQFLDVFALTTNSQLQHLDLSENRLKVIDDHLLYNLLHLKCLNLSGNALRFIVPRTFAENTMLVDLDLSRNRIVDLQDDALIGLRSLEYLNLKQNQISDLAPALFEDLTALKCLDLSANLLSILTDRQFAHLKSLNLLHLTSNIIRKTSNYSFAGLSQLECVDLSLNRLSEGNFLSQLTDLKMLNLSFNRFEAINSSVLHDIGYVEMVGNYWRCSWLIPELVNRRLSPGIHFLPNSTTRKSVYDEIDCYADTDDDEQSQTTVLPKHHSLRHIVVLRENAVSKQCSETNNHVEQSFTINIFYKRSFTKLVGENFDFTNSLIWVAVGMIILIILVHLGKYMSNDWNKLSGSETTRRYGVEERCFLTVPEESKTRM